MIQSLTLKNFRNFSQKQIHFSPSLNCIYGDNGFGKSNIVEAISLLSLGELFGLDFDSLTKINSPGFFIEIQTDSGTLLSLSYESETKKKHLSLGGKAISKTKFLSATFPCVVFHPLSLNMMYLSPSLRREYIDTVLIQAHSEYSSLLKRYKEVLRNRNKFLQSIYEGKSKKEDISFWDDSFVSLALQIYDIRYLYIDFIQESLGEYIFLLGGKVKELKFLYTTKVHTPNREVSLREYLEKNRERDIILGVTHIGPHVDDFDLLLDGKSITSYASRGETKTMVLGLKVLEARYLEIKKCKKPIIVIDDFLSEIDDTHKKYIFQTFRDYQTIISSISPLESEIEQNKIFL